MVNFDEAQAGKRTLKSVLTMRYIIALGLIALVMTTTYAFLFFQIKHNQKDAYIINISGKQRMLSQRIALFAREVYHAPSTTDADLYAYKMSSAVKTMEADHEALLLHIKSHKTNNSKLEKIYSDENGIEDRINQYLSLARQFLSLYDDGGVAAIRQSNEMNQIVSIARNGLLDQLDSAVVEFQKQSEENVKKFEVYETFFYCLGIFILLCEAFLIFRPMIRQIIDKTDKLETSNRELLEFSYRISHDLRAPIVSSLGLVDAAKKSFDKGNYDVASKAFEHISTSLNRLEDLIKDVLNLTRTKLEKAEKEYLDFSYIVQTTFDKLSHLDGVEKIRFDQNIELSDFILAHKTYLTQTIENLISNAIKYSDLQKNDPFILVTAKVKNGQCLISVLDNGIGIPESSRKDLFSMFARFHPRVSFGSGLGLYLVQQNVKAMGGDIKYVPHEEGSEFLINIPV